MIFLFNFEIKNNGIDFILNEGLARDMYPDLEVHLKDLVESTAQLLMRYRCYSNSNIIFTGKILDTDELELLFSKGLGQYINEYEKNIIYDTAKLISGICVEVMQRRSKE